jgi:hypothetical protein
MEAGHISHRWHIFRMGLNLPRNQFSSTVANATRVSANRCGLKHHLVRDSSRRSKGISFPSEYYVFCQNTVRERLGLWHNVSDNLFLRLSASAEAEIRGAFGMTILVINSCRVVLDIIRLYRSSDSRHPTFSRQPLCCGWRQGSSKLP